MIFRKEEKMEQKKLKKIMQERGITAYRLAIDCKIALSDIYPAINGKKTMFPRWRKSIAEYLKMEEKEIFEGV